jgi:FMN-dependent NADH-azoreductase
MPPPGTDGRRGVNELGTRLLHVISTPRGLASNTGRVSSALLEAILEQDDDVAVTTLDLFKTDLPSVAGRNIESKYKLMTGQALDAASLESWRDIERTIEQFLAADVYLMTVPMWNFGIPYALKYYIDAIVQPGYLFQYTPDGMVEGLVKGKKMICVTSRGSDYSNEPMKAYDFVESYLRSIFGFVGITDIRFFNAQPMDISREMRMAAQKLAIHDVREYAASGDWRIQDDAAAPSEEAVVA